MKMSTCIEILFLTYTDVFLFDNDSLSLFPPLFFNLLLAITGSRGLYAVSMFHMLL